MSKKLNIIEAMKMPIGTKFNFDIKSEAEYTEILKGLEEEKVLCWNGDKHAQVNICTSTSEMKLTLIQQPVSFMEAITSDKRIKVDATELNEKNRNLYSVVLNAYYNNCYFSINEILNMLINSKEYKNIIILEGKWYIEESEGEEIGD